MINYSISGSDDPTDPVELMFLSAASAGIFVAASAGNSGPGASTLQTTSPWVTTVGGQHGRARTTARSPWATGRIRRHLDLGDHRGRSGSAGQRFGPGRRRRRPRPNAALCAPGSLDPAKTAGKIVVCDRGVVDRVAKSAEVKRAGGIGMVLANPTDELPRR